MAFCCSFAQVLLKTTQKIDRSKGPTKNKNIVDRELTLNIPIRSHVTHVQHKIVKKTYVQKKQLDL